MQPIFARTFGGLTPEYYRRQLFFGSLMSLSLVYVIFFAAGGSDVPFMRAVGHLFMLTLNALLYPYARFVYESIFDFVLGENVFVVSMAPALILKVFSMAVCWGLAVFIAPLGLAYLYFSSRSAPTQ